MKTVFSSLAACIRNGKPCVLVSAVGGEGSAPRKTQSHMLVEKSGRLCGTVGGGALEGQSIVHAQQLLAHRRCDLREFELFAGSGGDIGMICGGRVSVFFRCVDAGDEQVLRVCERGAALLERGVNAWLMINLCTGGLTVFAENAIVGDAVPPKALAACGRAAGQIQIDGVGYYIERFASASRVYVFGGGHVAQALVPVLASVDFRCVVIEDRQEFCSKALFPAAEEVRMIENCNWANELDVGEEDCICIMTRGHKGDLACQAYALRTPASYIGVIGSRKKVAAVNAQLKDMGFSDSDLGRIITPIGLDIGAVTPAEIAVSIAAQMIEHRAGTRKHEIKKSCMG